MEDFINYLSKEENYKKFYSFCEEISQASNKLQLIKDTLEYILRLEKEKNKEINTDNILYKKYMYYNKLNTNYYYLATFLYKFYTTLLERYNINNNGAIVDIFCKNGKNYNELTECIINEIYHKRNDNEDIKKIFTDIYKLAEEQTFDDNKIFNNESKNKEDIKIFINKKLNYLIVVNSYNTIVKLETNEQFLQNIDKIEKIF